MSFQPEKIGEQSGGSGGMPQGELWCSCFPHSELNLGFDMFLLLD